MEHLTSRHALNQRYLGEIEARTGLPTNRLPLIATGIDGLDALRRLAAPLLDEPRRSQGRARDAVEVSS